MQRRHMYSSSSFAARCRVDLDCITRSRVAGAAARYLARRRLPRRAVLRRRQCCRGRGRDTGRRERLRDRGATPASRESDPAGRDRAFSRIAASVPCARADTGRAGRAQGARAREGSRHEAARCERERGLSCLAETRNEPQQTPHRRGGGRDRRRGVDDVKKSPFVHCHAEADGGCGPTGGRFEDKDVQSSRRQRGAWTFFVESTVKSMGGTDCKTSLLLGPGAACRCGEALRWRWPRRSRRRRTRRARRSRAARCRWMCVIAMSTSRRATRSRKQTPQPYAAVWATPPTPIAASAPNTKTKTTTTTTTNTTTAATTAKRNTL